MNELPLDVFEEKEAQKRKDWSEKEKQKKVSSEVTEMKEEEESEDSEDDVVLVIERSREGGVSERRRNWEEVEIDSGDDGNEVVPEATVLSELEENAVDALDHENMDADAGGEISSTDTANEESSSEESEAPTPQVRRSSRKVTQRKVFTYPELGADPVREAVT